MINENLYKRFEKETISKVNRFEISKKDLNELNSYILNKGFSLIDKKENVFLFIKS